MFRHGSVSSMSFPATLWNLHGGYIRLNLKKHFVSVSFRCPSPADLFSVIVFSHAYTYPKLISAIPITRSSEQ